MTEQVDTTFKAILDGTEPGTIIARDDAKQMALIKSNHPESSVHWIAVPYEAVASTEEMLHEDKDRFLELIDYAITNARELADEYPRLQQGFTLKIHCGSFETMRHAKVHVLAAE